MRPAKDIYFKDPDGLQSLYIRSGSTEEQLNPELIAKFEQQTGLVFRADRPEAGNVCLANAEEVLPAFRTDFSTADLLNYVRGVQKSQIFVSHSSPGQLELPYPGTAEFFWQQASLGKR